MGRSDESHLVREAVWALRAVLLTRVLCGCGREDEVAGVAALGSAGALRVEHDPAELVGQLRAHGGGAHHEEQRRRSPPRDACTPPRPTLECDRRWLLRNASRQSRAPTRASLFDALSLFM
eukprot:2496660-Pleurochrysis_carterae.AAC.1